MRLTSSKNSHSWNPLNIHIRMTVAKLKRNAGQLRKTTGQRKEDEKRKKVFLYEVAWQGKSHESNNGILIRRLN